MDRSINVTNGIEDVDIIDEFEEDENDMLDDIDDDYTNNDDECGKEIKN